MKNKNRPKNLVIGDIVENEWAGHGNPNQRLLFLKYLTTRIRCINSKGLIVLIQDDEPLTKVGHIDLKNTLFKNFKQEMANV